MDRLFPANNARKIALLMLISMVLTYILKIIIALRLLDTRVTSGMAWELICPLACVMGMGLIAVPLWLTGISMIRNLKGGLPVLALWCGLIISVVIPLPSLPRPVFPEESFFAAHRADFEQVVTLARENTLSCSQSECHCESRNLPSAYRYLSQYGSVDVIDDPDSGLRVIFEPLNIYYPVIYFEQPDAMNEAMYSMCGANFVSTRVLGEHWYLCARGD
ncbi:MAG: hypothetical protein ABI700_19815 [Chloroflexota bacterium]